MYNEIVRLMMALHIVLSISWWLLSREDIHLGGAPCNRRRLRRALGRFIFSPFTCKH